MKTFDELRAMTDEQKLAYLSEEVEKVIASAPPRVVLKLRALQSRMDRIHMKVQNPLVRLNMIYNEMIRALLMLNETLKPLRK